MEKINNSNKRKAKCRKQAQNLAQSCPSHRISVCKNQNLIYRPLSNCDYQRLSRRINIANQRWTLSPRLYRLDFSPPQALTSQLRSFFAKKERSLIVYDNVAPSVRYISSKSRLLKKKLFFVNCCSCINVALIETTDRSSTEKWKRKSADLGTSCLPPPMSARDHRQQRQARVRERKPLWSCRRSTEENPTKRQISQCFRRVPLNENDHQISNQWWCDCHFPSTTLSEK